MSEQFYTILTKIGKAKIANSAALGNQVNLVKFQIGDGGGSYYSPTEDQTKLKNKVWEGNISSVRIDDENPNWIVLETLIPGTEGGFMVREAAAVDNEGNLIAIGKYPETYKPVAGDGSIKDLIIKMVLEVSNTSAVTLKVDPTVILATKNDILELDKKVNKNTSDIKKLTNTIETLELVDTKIKLTDPENIFNLGEDANINQALLSNKTSISNLESGLEETNTDLKNIGENFNKLKDKVDKGQNHKLCEDNGTAILLDIGFDLNTLRDTGIYNGNQFLNAPNNSGDWWYIEVMQHTNLNGFVYQKATSLADYNNIQVFHRQMVGNTWGEWRSL